MTSYRGPQLCNITSVTDLYKEPQSEVVHRWHLLDTWRRWGGGGGGGYNGKAGDERKGVQEHKRGFGVKTSQPCSEMVVTDWASC